MNGSKGGIGASVYEGRGGRSEMYEPFAIGKFRNSCAIVRNASLVLDGVSHERGCIKEVRTFEQSPF